MNTAYKIKMQIQTSSDYSQFLQQYRTQQNSSQYNAQVLLNAKKSTLPFRTMIDRIHNVRPGCGSCGK